MVKCGSKALHADDVDRLFRSVERGADGAGAVQEKGIGIACIKQSHGFNLDFGKGFAIDAIK